jgi:uncharacterized Zn finger protein
MLPASAAITAKAAHLLSSGRVTVSEANDSSGIFIAAVAGDRGTYSVFRGGAAGPWYCDCAAGLHGRACAHVTAVALVAG